MDKRNVAEPVEILKTGLNGSEVAQLKKASAAGQSADKIARHFRVPVKLVEDFIKYYSKDIKLMKNESKVQEDSRKGIAPAKVPQLETRISELEKVNKEILRQKDEATELCKKFQVSNKELAEANIELGKTNLELIAAKETAEAEFAQYKADIEKAQADEATAALSENKDE